MIYLIVVLNSFYAMNEQGEYGFIGDAVKPYSPLGGSKVLAESGVQGAMEFKPFDFGATVKVLRKI